MRSPKVLAVPLAFVLTVAAFAGAAVAQTGTGGSTGTGTLTNTDFFITVQRDQGVNLTEFQASQLLNQANCLCKTPIWIKGVLLGSAQSKIATIDRSSLVSLRIGEQCNVSTQRPYCRVLGEAVTFNNFLTTGITAKTTVEEMSYIYSISGANAVTPPAGSDPATVGGCYGRVHAQPIWLFITSSGSEPDFVGTSNPKVDVQPPPAPTSITVAPAHEALIANWTAVPIGDATDLKGYQILCTRADLPMPVFKEGTFSAAFDGCPGAGTGTPIENHNPAFVCSDIIPSTTYRLKILQNAIPYGVGVVAIDNQRNASAVRPIYESPVATKDFYFEYRHGDPQGSATGGFCAVGGDGPHTGAAAVIGALVALGIAAARRGRRSERRS